MMNFNECMEFVNSYSKSGKPVTDLSRAENLMRLMGNPEKKLKFVHVAGTNGKGSVVEYISNALMYSGYKVGQFTSPFVLHYTDRIRINGNEIDEKSLCEICSFIKENIDDKPYSQFEITMAIAFLWYLQENCYIVVLECGIGGLLDCTNVIPPPLLSVITSIGLDHTAILGNTVKKIAQQKAGIIKEGSAVVLSLANKKSVVRIIEDKALEKNAEFIMPEWRNFKYFAMETDGNPFRYKGEEYKTAMLGFHQPINAVTAIEACKYLHKKYIWVTDEAIRKSIETTQIKARCQYIAGNPPVIVDGGHNPDGISRLRGVLEYFMLRKQKIFAVVGMIDSKDYEFCIEDISRPAEKVFTVDDFAPNAVKAEKLAQLAGEFAFDEVCHSLDIAVEKATAHAVAENGLVVVCGSLYLASKYLNNYQK